MQIVRLNCAFSRNLGRGDDVDGLGAIMRGILENMCFFAPFIACILNIPRDSCAASAFHYNGDRYK